MMTQDQLLAAHAKRPASRFSDAGLAAAQGQKPRWSAGRDSGGDLMAFRAKKEESGHAEDGR